MCIFACSTLTLYFCCLKVACYPERVSLDDYMGFMPDLTHSEKVHVQFCPKVIVYFILFFLIIVQYLIISLVVSWFRCVTTYSIL